MLYLGTCPNQPEVAALLDSRRIGLMCQPASNKPRVGWLWAADNGCFNAKWDYDKWVKWLYSTALPRSGCLFAVVPDVVGDHYETLARFEQHRRVVRGARVPLAFVGQDGATVDTTPWDEFDAYFVGGTTKWKGSEVAFRLAQEARRRGKWVHVGRINGGGRFQTWAPFADSCDGTFLAYGPKVNTPRLTAWLDTLEREPSLWVRTMREDTPDA